MPAIFTPKSSSAYTATETGRKFVIYDGTRTVTTLKLMEPKPGIILMVM